MNCKKAKENISIREVLESFSVYPSKDNRRTAFYYAFDREEKTPSLSVDFIKNTAFDFGTGKQYDVISLVQGIKKCSVSEALEYLSRFDFSFSKQKIQEDFIVSKPKICEVKHIEHPALKRYLKQRRIIRNYSLISEIHYEIKNKIFFGIGFKNESNGYEVRSKVSKICLGKKDISIIRNNSTSVKIFEGFFDFLSFKQIESSLQKPLSDYIVLNSVSMIFRLKNLIESYAEIELYFDNDEAGNRAVEQVKQICPIAADCRILYQGYKDLNDFIMGQSSFATELVQKVPIVYKKCGA